MTQGTKPRATRQWREALIKKEHVGKKPMQLGWFGYFPLQLEFCEGKVWVCEDPSYPGEWVIYRGWGESYEHLRKGALFDLYFQWPGPEDEDSGRADEVEARFALISLNGHARRAWRD